RNVAGARLLDDGKGAERDRPKLDKTAGFLDQRLRLGLARIGAAPQRHRVRVTAFHDPTGREGAAIPGAPFPSPRAGGAEIFAEGHDAGPQRRDVPELIRATWL